MGRARSSAGEHTLDMGGVPTIGEPPMVKNSQTKPQSVLLASAACAGGIDARMILSLQTG